MVQWQRNGGGVCTDTAEEFGTIGGKTSPETKMQHSSGKEPTGHRRSQRSPCNASESRGKRRRHGGAERLGQQEEEDLFTVTSDEGWMKGKGENNPQEQTKGGRHPLHRFPNSIRLI